MGFINSRHAENGDDEDSTRRDMPVRDQTDVVADDEDGTRGVPTATTTESEVDTQTADVSRGGVEAPSGTTHPRHAGWGRRTREGDGRNRPSAKWERALGGRLPAIFTWGKLAICLVLAIVAFYYFGGRKMLVFQLIEAVVIFLLSLALAYRHRHIARVVNDVLTILYVIQVFVLIFGNTYLSANMMDNLASIQDIAGKATQYLLAVAAVFIVGLIPISAPRRLRWSSVSCALSTALVVELAAVLALGNSYSPIFSYALLAQHYITRSIGSYNGNEVVGEFYRSGINEYRDKDAALPEQPNIILIFTEGLSENIVEDERGIMPNVAEWQQKSLSFSSYYNHTFATYHGIIGQLYSGWTYGNRDSNNLVSLQQILSDEGYATTFLNTEPNNGDFTSYLNTMGFDEVLSDTSRASDTANCTVTAAYVTDKDAYAWLQETVQAQHDEGQPFLTTMYTFGTHATFDSDDEKFGDGTDTELNKFYNADHWFGEFMDWFDQSDLAEDTIVIFTADHATYNDFYFSQAFPDTVRVNGGCDTIPLFFYYKGIAPERLDVGGRNSLDLVPTLLDYLDISAPNYFLGFTLFVPSGGESMYDYYYSDNNVISSSQGDVINILSEDQCPDFVERLHKYYAAAASGPA